MVPRVLHKLAAASHEALRRTVAWERANPSAQIDPAQYDYAAEDATLAELDLSDRASRIE